MYLGIDSGSVTTKLALLSEEGKLIASCYLRNCGKPIIAIQEGLLQIAAGIPAGGAVVGVGTTGSARYLAGAIVCADVVKNEITCQAVGTLHYVPNVQTILEIGGQDSKIILIRNGIVTDFGMNTVCAAGTGSFLDHQSQRLGMSIEDFAKMALRSKSPVHIVGRCTVFAESNMIQKQQQGHKLEDIAMGLCETLVSNYLGNVGLGKEILPPIVFQGGVAFNQGFLKALEHNLDIRIIVPSHHEVMGAIGAAILAKEEMEFTTKETSFKGFNVAEADYNTTFIECKACPNKCEIAEISLNGETQARWGGMCDLWDGTSRDQEWIEFYNRQ